MASIKIEVSEKEMDALKEYAKQCGETIPSLIRKLAIREATLADGYGVDDSSYDLMMMPVENSASGERKRLEEGYNRIRRILGWKEIHL